MSDSDCEKIIFSDKKWIQDQLTLFATLSWLDVWLQYYPQLIFSRMCPYLSMSLKVSSDVMSCNCLYYIEVMSFFVQSLLLMESKVFQLIRVTLKSNCFNKYLMLHACQLSQSLWSLKYGHACQYLPSTLITYQNLNFFLCLQIIFKKGSNLFLSLLLLQTNTFRW